MVCIAYTKQFLFKTFFPIIHTFLEIFQQFEKLDILCKYFFNWLYNIFTIIVDTHYRKKFLKRYSFRKAVSFPQNQFSEQNRKVSSIGFESEDYMLHGQRALWLGYPCSNGKLPFSHCQGNIAESTKLGDNCHSRFSSFFLFLFSPLSNKFMPSDGACASYSDDGDKYDDSRAVNRHYPIYDRIFSRVTLIFYDR